MSVRGIKQNLSEAALSVYTLYTEKGIAPLRIPLLVICCAVLMLYSGVYGRIISGLERTRSELNSLEASAKYARIFEDYRSRLGAYEKRLPLLKDKDKWLFDVVMAAAQKEGVRPDTVSAQAETEMDDFIVASREISAAVSFKSAAKLLARIENSPFLVKISQLTVKKDPARLGIVKIQFQVSTVFLKTRLTQSARQT